jgi:hypothetical protein
MAMRRLAKPFTPIRLAALVGLAIGVLALNAAAPPEAFAVCNHAGNTSSACPVGVADGSTSISFNADGSINWPGGVITSGNCCAASGGTETGGGLQNLNNTLGNAGDNLPHFGPTVPGRLINNPNPFLGSAPGGFQTFAGYPGQTASGGLPTNVDCGLNGTCGSDGYVPPPVSFGGCSQGGGSSCGFTSLNTNLSNPYYTNSTTGLVDPFGGSDGYFSDPATGETIQVPEDPAQWSDKIKKAKALN